MTLKEMQKKILALIEELNPESEFLTDDPDIKAKINHVINQVLYELARMKKIPRYIEIDVSAGELVDFAKLGKDVKSEVYQIKNAEGVNFEYKADGTVLKALQSGTMGVELYIYPERITEKTKANGYEFELSADALEIMPYGVAGDLLKSDKSAEYGSIYTKRYEDMKMQLDPRYNLGSITVEGGVYI